MYCLRSRFLTHSSTFPPKSQQEDNERLKQKGKGVQERTSDVDGNAISNSYSNSLRMIICSHGIIHRYLYGNTRSYHEQSVCWRYVKWL